MPKTAAQPETYRPALVPGVIAAAALMAGIGLMGTDAFLVIRFIVAIFALIVAWFALQAAQWWWTAAFVIVAVVWNPIAPVPFEGLIWIIAHIVAAALFVVAGGLIRLERPAPAR